MLILRTMTNVNLIKIYSAGNHYQFIFTRKDNYTKMPKLPTVEQDGEYLERNMELNDVFNFFLQTFFCHAKEMKLLLKFI